MFSDTAFFVSYLMLSSIIYIGLGGALGAIARFMAVEIIKHITNATYHAYITAYVNIIGSFLIGLLFVYFSHSTINQNLKYFAIIGVLGSFTTFSTFSLDTIKFIQQGLWENAFIYVILSVIISIFAAFAGITVGRIFL